VIYTFVILICIFGRNKNNKRCKVHVLKNVVDVLPRASFNYFSLIINREY
jgi:hypothetical protein